MRPHGSPAELESRRRRAVAMLNEGVEPYVVAHRLGVDRRSVRRWNRAFRRKGDAGLTARPAPGRPPKLTARQRRSLTAWIVRGAEACGFRTALWTCRRVAELIRREFHVTYHPDHVGRVLRSCGFTPQRPERKAKERDDQRVRLWVQTEWAVAKKNSVGLGRG